LSNLSRQQFIDSVRAEQFLNGCYCQFNK